VTDPDPTPDEARAFAAGLRAAREVVARQADLTDLVHFERPSDYRKGVLTCLAALDAAIKEAPELDRALARVRAEALQEAAEQVRDECRDSDEECFCGSRRWLYERAARIRRGESL